MSIHLQALAHVPLKQSDNRVWRTYEGGALIDRWKQMPEEIDNNKPEQWIMSTVTARGKNRPEHEGQSVISTDNGSVHLKQIIQSNPALFLGKALAKKYGDTGVLIKMLDSVERLTIQVHPDKAYAKNILNSEFGKTESWYILNTRTIDGEEPVIYMGFKKHVTKALWKACFDKQDIEAMLGCLHKIKVAPGDAYMIYGGVPHAIGAGCFLMEVQEPTDYTMRTEKTTPKGLKIGPELIHQGVGEETMLDCFHYDTFTEEEAMANWKVEPEVLDQGDGYTYKTLFNKKHTPCFGLNELDLTDSYTLAARDTFYVMVIYAGEGLITCNEKQYPFKQADEIFISAAIDQITIQAHTPAKILLCYPPIV